MVDNVIINDKFSLDAKIGPAFQTTIVPLLGGYEDRNSDIPRAFFRFEVELKNRSMSEIDAFDIFLMGRRGAARTFLARHPLYNTLTNEVIGTGDGSTAAFQVKQLFNDSVNPYYHYWYTVQSLVIKVDGVTKTSGVHYNETDGLVTFTGGNIPSGGSPAQTITASGSTYVRVRFAEDYNPISFPISPDLTNSFASAGPFTLLEVPA